MVQPLRLGASFSAFSAIDRHPLLRGRTGARLAPVLISSRAEANEVVIAAGEVPPSVLFLLSGSVRATVGSEDGREGLARIVVAPDVLGSLEAFVDRPSAVTVRAMEVVRIAAVPRRAWVSALAEDEVLRRAWLELVANELERTTARCARTLFGRLEERLAELLLEYLAHYALPVPRGRRIRIRLRHEDLADALGAARRSVTRILTEWRLRGWVFHEGGCFIVIDEGALRAVAGA